MLIYWFILSAVYALGLFFCYADWIWFHLLPPAVQWGVFAAVLPIGAAWLTWAFHRDRRGTRWWWIVVTGVYLLWLPAAVYLLATGQVVVCPLAGVNCAGYF